MSERAKCPIEIYEAYAFPKKIRAFGGTMESLGDTVFRLKSEQSEDYPAGTLVRLISNAKADDKKSGKTPGFHSNPDYVSVCRLQAKAAEYVGVKKEELE